MKLHRVVAPAALAVLAISSSASAQVRRVVVADPVFVAPARAVYVAPAPVVYAPTAVTRVPVGATAYVAPAPVAYVPARRVYTTTTTVVPATTTVGVGGAYVVDRAVAPVGYEVVRTRRAPLLFPRRAFLYGY